MNEHRLSPDELYYLDVDDEKYICSECLERKHKKYFELLNNKNEKLNNDKNNQ